MLYALWAIVGWCGTPYIWWWFKLPVPGPRPGPDPGPDPWPIIKLIGVVGGLVGGWVFTRAFGIPVPWDLSGPRPEPWVAVLAAASSVGAFVGSVLFTDIYGMIRSAGKKTQG
jgi:hypothetical protein